MHLSEKQQAEIAAMRAAYAQRVLLREDLDADPVEQFAKWFEEACRAAVPEPNAMSLATVSADGQPSLRTVLLKGYDARGFTFFTNFQSRKSREIEQNPRVALLFPWIVLERQVTITGVCEKLSAAESLKYFVNSLNVPLNVVWFEEVHLALVEAVSNIMRHSLGPHAGYISGMYAIYDRTLEVVLVDNGRPFEWDSRPMAYDSETPAEHGYGMHIIRDVMDSIQYQRLPGRFNHWKLVRQLPH